MITEALSMVVEGDHLDGEAASRVMMEMMEGAATQSQIGAFIAALRMKGVATSEMLGFVRAMRLSSPRVTAPGGAIDLCGTGGDSTGSFNISTAACFVAAACGVPVAKHGNRCVSSRSGSADVLEALHVPIDLGPAEVERCLNEAGMGFMFAPTFHRSMANVSCARREIGLRSVFNVLGPLTNPAGVRRQVIGVYDISMAPRLASVLAELGSEHVLFVNGMGMDEITLAGETEAVELRGKEIRERVIRPEDMGLERADPSTLRGGGPEENSRIMLSVLRGEDSPRTDAVLANAGAGIHVSGRASSLEEGVEMAREAVRSGEAYMRLKLYSRLAAGLEARMQATMPLQELEGRRIHPRVLMGRARELVDDRLQLLEEKEMGHLTDGLDPSLISSPSVLSVLVLDRLLSPPGGGEERTGMRGGRLSEAIRSPGISLIAEYKPSSPSVLPPFVAPPPSLVEEYVREGAAGVSVLAEGRHFGGGPALFSEARRTVRAPMLYKDLLATEGQLDVARRCGADAVLLIAKALERDHLSTMVERCASLGMEPLVEVHDPEDLSKLEASGSLESVGMIGVNCRDLRTLITRPRLFAEMKSRLPDDKLLIAESGLVGDVFGKVRGYDAVLVGTRFMTSPDPSAELRRTMRTLREVG